MNCVCVCLFVCTFEVAIIYPWSIHDPHSAILNHPEQYLDIHSRKLLHSTKFLHPFHTSIKPRIRFYQRNIHPSPLNEFAINVYEMHFNFMKNRAVNEPARLRNEVDALFMFLPKILLFHSLYIFTLSKPNPFMPPRIKPVIVSIITGIH